MRPEHFYSGNLLCTSFSTRISSGFNEARAFLLGKYRRFSGALKKVKSFNEARAFLLGKSCFIFFCVVCRWGFNEARAFLLGKSGP